MIEPILTLEETKLFLRCDTDDEDATISSLIQTASETTMSHADGLIDGEEVPESIRTAALLLVAHWFSNREAVNIGNTTTEVPMGSVWLANRYRAWGV